MNYRWFGRCTAAIGFGLVAVGGLDAQSADSLRGSWRATEYRLANGVRHPVDGLITFTAHDWTVLYFVLDETGRPGRGSGEGGTYSLAGNRLVFTHRYHFATGRAMPGLEAEPLTMTARPAGAQAPTESSTIDITGTGLVISFPSGNRMVFRRSSPPD